MENLFRSHGYNHYYCNIMMKRSRDCKNGPFVLLEGHACIMHFCMGHCYDNLPRVLMMYCHRSDRPCGTSDVAGPCVLKVNTPHPIRA